MIPIYEPYLPKSSLRYAHDAIDSTWISSRGKYIQMAQEKLQDMLGAKYVQLLNNGTSACHLVSKSLARKLNKAGKKQILVPQNCYVAAWNSLLFDNEFKLITVKTDINTWNIDLDDLDNKLLKYPYASVLIVHNMGNVIDVPKLKSKYTHTTFIEDACEALFGKYGQKYVGTESFASAISTFANKSLSSGEGGMLLTNDEDTYNWVKCIQSQGQSETRFVHNELGYNYRMTNIQAAILLGQLEIADEIIDLKNGIFDRYRKAFSNRNNVFVQSEMSGTENGNWMFGIRLPGNKSYKQMEIYFAYSGIEVRPFFYPITAHEHLKRDDIIVDDCSIDEQLHNEAVILPSFPGLSIGDQDKIIQLANEYIEGTR